MNYLIAFGGRPKPTFVNALIDVAEDSDVELKGLLLTHGPGCYNLAIALDGENEPFINQLTIALMPAKWTTTNDPQLELGKFIDRVNTGEG